MEVVCYSPTTTITLPTPLSHQNPMHLQHSLSTLTFLTHPHNKNFTFFPNTFAKPSKNLTNNSFAISSSTSHNYALHNRTNITARGETSEVAPSSDSISEVTSWVVLMDKPPECTDDVMDYYVTTLQSALGKEKDAKDCIYDTFFGNAFGFRCNVDEETSLVLAGLPGVLSVKPDIHRTSVKKDGISSFSSEVNEVPNGTNGSPFLFPGGWDHWIVCVEEPSTRFSSKRRAVDYYAGLLAKVLGNEVNAQMCIYHVSWQSKFGFCCVLDKESALELGALPGVLTVKSDEDFESKDKDYGDSRLSSYTPDSTSTAETSQTKLFITGLSFYTSEKTLRAACEPYGELAEVKIVMDRISKRSKGFAFVEYTTEEAATTALQEMNGKIINGWKIGVERAKARPTYMNTI